MGGFGWFLLLAVSYFVGIGRKGGVGPQRAPVILGSADDRLLNTFQNSTDSYKHVVAPWVAGGKKYLGKKYPNPWQVAPDIPLC